MSSALRDYGAFCARAVGHLTVVKPYMLRNRQSAFSFTFDDVRSSACETGTEILESHGVRGTYYVSAGLRDKVIGNDPCWTGRQLERVLSGGHEIGCHTFGHRALEGCSEEDIRGEFDRNAAELKRDFGITKLRSFAYPFGRMDLRAKRVVAERFATGRSVREGIHKGRVDLSDLRVIPLGPGEREKERCLTLIDRARNECQWIVFYTHDVSPVPTPCGCRPDAFADVVRHVTKSGCPVLPVGDALGFV